MWVPVVIDSGFSVHNGRCFLGLLAKMSSDILQIFVRFLQLETCSSQKEKQNKADEVAQIKWDPPLPTQQVGGDWRGPWSPFIWLILSRDYVTRKRRLYVYWEVRFRMSSLEEDLKYWSLFFERLEIVRWSGFRSSSQSNGQTASQMEPGSVNIILCLCGGDEGAKRGVAAPMTRMNRCLLRSCRVQRRLLLSSQCSSVSM
jgi:hypothetical protein